MGQLLAIAGGVIVNLGAAVMIIYRVGRRDQAVESMLKTLLTKQQEADETMKEHVETDNASFLRVQQQIADVRVSIATVQTRIK